MSRFALLVLAFCLLACGCDSPAERQQRRMEEAIARTKPGDIRYACKPQLVELHQRARKLVVKPACPGCGKRFAVEVEPPPAPVAPVRSCARSEVVIQTAEGCACHECWARPLLGSWLEVPR